MKRFLERLRKQSSLVVLEMLLLFFFIAHVFTDKGQYFHWDFIDKLEYIAYDARVILSTKDSIDKRIVIVDIDEKSLLEIGRWPWGRNKLAGLTKQLFDRYNVEVVGFDVVFAEPDTSSGLHILEQLARNEFSEISLFSQHLDSIRPSLDYDQLFIDTLKGNSVILGYFFRSFDKGEKIIKAGTLPEPLFSKDDFIGFKFSPPSAEGYGASIESIASNAFSAGHFNPTLDDDGSVRRVPLLYQFEDNYYESLSLAIIRHLLKEKSIEFEDGLYSFFSNYNYIDSFKIGNHRIPIDENSNVLVPYRGKEHSFPYVSAADVINGTIDNAVLNEKLILVGSSAKGLFDLRNTPVQSAFPGVEIHANLISGVFDQRVKEQPFYTLGGEILILVIIGIFMGLLLPTLTPQTATIFTFGLLALILALNIFAWTQINLVIPIAASILMILVMFLLDMSFGFFVTKRGEKQITGLFGQYIPPELVEEMSNDPGRYTLEAEVRDLTVLFSDIRDFTSISEAMSAQGLSDLLNEYLTPMTNIIQKYHGTIDKYIGDAVMAFWGAPLRHPDHAKRALEAALEMLTTLKEMNKEFVKKGWPELRIGIGLNTGDMRVGDMGSEFRKAYTVMGDAVNLGARLEGQTKSYGVELIVNETTKAAVPDYLYRELDRIRVKGKHEPVTIYEPICLKEDVDKPIKDELKLYRQAVVYYREQNWDMAEIQFLNLLNASGGRPLYQLYIDRIQAFRSKAPDKDWDGVFTYTTK